MFNSAWTFFKDPLGEVFTVMGNAWDSVTQNMGMVSLWIGMFSLFALLNVLIWGLLRFLDLLGVLWTIIRLFAFLPVFVFLFKLLGWVFKGFVAMAESTRSMEKKKNEEEK